MLLLISLLAVGGMQGSILQERMASNSQDQAISFQSAETALRQGEDDLMDTDTPNVRQTAWLADPLPSPWAWDGNNPAASGTGDAGGQVNAEPVFHQARLVDVCSFDPTQPCFERFTVTSRAQGGSDQAISVLQTTVLLPPE
jgi:type IV pilus assembly protein PilX